HCSQPGVLLPVIAGMEPVRFVCITETRLLLGSCGETVDGSLSAHVAQPPWRPEDLDGGDVQFQGRTSTGVPAVQSSSEAEPAGGCPAHLPREPRSVARN